MTTTITLANGIEIKVNEQEMTTQVNGGYTRKHNNNEEMQKDIEKSKKIFGRFVSGTIEL